MVELLLPLSFCSPNIIIMIVLIIMLKADTITKSCDISIAVLITVAMYPSLPTVPFRDWSFHEKHKCTFKKIP